MNILNQREQAVLHNYLLSDEFDRDAHVLKGVHLGTKVKVLDIQTHIFSAFGGDGSIPEAF
jgi:hypothetical protein